MHAARVAEEFEIETVIVPPSCGVGSAVGLLGSDLSTDRVVTRICGEADIEGAAIEAIYEQLSDSAAHDLGVELAADTTRVERSVDVRLAGQAHELTIRLDDDTAGDWGETTMARLRTRFSDKYQESYGIPGTGPVELVSFRVRVTRVVPKVPLGQRVASDPDLLGPTRKRQIWFREYGEFRETPVYERVGMLDGNPVPGPLVIADGESTIVVPPTWSATVDSDFNVVLSRAAKEEK
jgi:N-methylhydantoinase A